MSDPPPPVSDHALGAQDRGAQLAALYDRALPHVYGYLLSRCGAVALAEDLTADTMLAAVDAVRGEDPPAVSVPWLVGVARHKLVDHWRRLAREERGLRAVADPLPPDEASSGGDAWDARIDAMAARETLDTLSPLHRAVLTLRYVDDLTVPDVAALVDRSVHATEGLLVRARAAFRRGYGVRDDSEDRDD